MRPKWVAESGGIGRLETVPRGGRGFFFVDGVTGSGLCWLARVGVEGPKKGDLVVPVALTARSVSLVSSGFARAGLLGKDS